MSNGFNYVPRSGSRFGAQYQNDADKEERQKRHISFEQVSQICAVELRDADVHRNCDDGDVSMEVEAKVRRRSYSPILNDGKLVATDDNWYQVAISHGRDAYDRDTLMASLLAVLLPEVFEPKYWRSEEHSEKFYVDDLELAKRIQETSRNAQLPNGFPMHVRVSSGIPPISITDDYKLKMKMVMAKRYNAKLKAIDLSRFQQDADFKTIFCPLFREPVLALALDIIYTNIPDLEAMNLSDNQLSSLEAFRGVEKRLPALKIIHLCNNNLPSLAHLLLIHKLPIEELMLHNNPCYLRYKDRDEFATEVFRKFPKLRQLDDKTFNQPLATAPPTYLCNIAGKDIVQQFLDEYFKVFDSNSRLPLLDAYHEQAKLSITMPSFSGANQLQKFYPFNRNLLRISEPEQHRLLKQGRLECVGLLAEWPRTLHERQTFTVDLTAYSPPQLIAFTVTGLFRELVENGSALDAPKVRHFMRSFVVEQQQNAGYCICNETMFLDSATPKQTREFIGLQLQHNVAIAPMVPNPTISDASKLAMLHNMCAHSNMNLYWSRNCLEDSKWDFSLAATLFDVLDRDKKIPPQAFTK